MAPIKLLKSSWVLCLFFLCNEVHAYRLSSLLVCDNKDYLFKNYFYMQRAGKKVKEWYQYYPIVDETMSVVDVNVTLIREKEAPTKVRLIYFKKGEKQSHFDKTFSLKRVGREFYFKDFDYAKDIPNPQTMPGILNMVLLGQKQQPLCRIKQTYRYVSYD